MKPEGKQFIIVEMTAVSIQHYNTVPSQFAIEAIVQVNHEGSRFTIAETKLPQPHQIKIYPNEPWQPHGRHAVYFAMLGSRCTGQVYIQEYWNGMARVEDIRVDEAFRGKGIGRKLMDAAMNWAKAQGFSIVCLETQDINAAACRFYAAYGFVLSGVDYEVYETTGSKGETALYWYCRIA